MENKEHIQHLFSIIPCLSCCTILEPPAIAFICKQYYMISKILVVAESIALFFNEIENQTSLILCINQSKCYYTQNAQIYGNNEISFVSALISDIFLLWFYRHPLSTLQSLKAALVLIFLIFLTFPKTLFCLSVFKERDPWLFWVFRIQEKLPSSHCKNDCDIK